MQKLPENIDEIEAFYKNGLEELEIAPSPALWANISKNIPVPSPSSAFPIKNWIIGSVSGVVALVGVYSYMQNLPKSQTVDTTKVIEEVPLPNPSQNTHYKDSASNYQERKNKDQNLTEISSGNKEAGVKIEIPQKSSTENTPSLETETKIESIQESELELKEKQDHLVEIESLPAKPVDSDHQVEKPHPSFFEKKASQVKDSARPLFVPKKK